jgi:tripartite motif-containing protein 71
LIFLNPIIAGNGSEHSGIPTKKISGDLSGRSRYAALRDRRAKVARSKSTAVVGFKSNNDDDDDDDEDDDDDNDDSVQTPFTSRFGRELAKSRSSHFLKAAEDSDSGLPSSSAPMTSDDDNLSSWARYLKNKYGGRTTKQSGNNNENNENKNNDANTNFYGPTGMHMQKQSILLTFGARGSQPGLFTWPRGIAVGADNTIVVADSSNHRVQIFNENGQHRFSFGCYGNGEGEFDCLAGVAVNRIGQFIIADRYNHRIQIFDASGHFIRSFGSQGTVDGKFSYPWGITTDALGLIYVCDKENHRVQVYLRLIFSFSYDNVT